MTALQVSYRPCDLEAFYGNDSTVESLRSVLSRKEFPRAFLFTGPSGCGKTTLAYIVAQAVGGDGQDISYYNASNTRGIDTVRSIEKLTYTSPMMSKARVFILDECHQITGPAQEALLKVLEDGTPSSFFILCTTEPDKLKPTLKRRCHSYEVAPMMSDTLRQLLDDVLDAEGLSPADYTKIIAKIVNVSNGSPGLALRFLDQIIDMEDEQLALDTITQITFSEASTLDLCRALIARDDVKKWATVKGILRDIKGEPEQIRYAILSYFEKALLDNGDEFVARKIPFFLDSFMYTGRAGLIFCCYQACTEE